MNAMKKNLSRILSAAMALLLLVTLIPGGLLSPLQSRAAAYTVGTETELRDTVAAALPGDVITLGANINLTTGPLVVTTADPGVTLGGAYSLIQTGYVDGIQVQAGAALTIDGITVTHPANITGTGVVVSAGGKLVLNSGAITNNASYNNAPGGNVNNAGTFIINAGTISGGGATLGGNVYNTGTLTMNGGTISNAAYGSGTGAGVWTSGSFTMNDGAITGNMTYPRDTFGSGVYVQSGTFDMVSGTISGNSGYGNAKGIGVAVNTGATFTMSGGSITGNQFKESATVTDGNRGAGVYSAGVFNMSGGSISENNISTYGTNGGGVYVQSGAFTMTGGAISNNATGSVVSGGGVYVQSGAFNLSGGAITGNSAMSGNGGGIYLANAGVLHMSNDAEISGNSTTGSGGGIYTPYANLSNVNIGPDTVFANNRAGSGYARAPADDALYAAHVLREGDWSLPTVPVANQGYNNWDIAYTVGTALTMYVVTYNSTGSTGGTAPVDNNYYGQFSNVTIAGQGTLVKSGYTFLGWATTSGVTTPNYFMGANLIIGANTSFYPVWATTPSQVTVIFQDKDPVTGTPVSPPLLNISVPFGVALGSGNIPAAPSRPGYTFTGWSNGVNTYSAAQLASYVMNTNVVFTAQYTASVLTVTFNQGAHGTIPTNPSTETVGYGDKVTSVPNVTPNSGYTFSGWLSSAGGTYDADTVLTLPVTVNVSYTAQYTSLSNATVIFNYNGGTDAASACSSSASGTAGSAYDVPQPTRAGYTLSGWTSNGSAAIPSGSFGTAGSVTTYVAQWKINTYTVTFAQGLHGTIPVDPLAVGVNYGSTVNSAPSVTPQSGYVFIGWQSNSGGIYDSVSVLALPITSNIVFTAQYIHTASDGHATVIFDYNGGTDGIGGLSSLTGLPGETYVTPTPCRSGYLFNCWALPAPDGIFGEADSVTVFSAQWTPVAVSVESFTVAFNPGVNGALTTSGDPLASQTVNAGNSITGVPAITPNSGYSFIGWSDSNGALYSSTASLTNPVTADVTYTAQYAAVNAGTATVIFDYNGGTDGTGSLSYFVGQPGNCYTTPNPTRDGYALDCWSPAEPDGKFGASGNVVVYSAQWTPHGSLSGFDSFTVTFEPGTNGAFTTPGDPLASQSVNSGDSITGVPAITANSGYSFIGWSDSNGALYSSTASLTNPVTADVTYTAQYAAIGASTATVIFDYNGGTDGKGSLSYLTGQSGDSYTTPAPTRTGYEFNGWLPGTPTGTFGAAGSVTVYSAQWTPAAGNGSFTVTFDPASNGTLTTSGDPLASQSVNSGDSITGVPAITANSGYNFLGWQNSNGGVYDSAAVLKYVVTGNVTFTAQYYPTPTGGDNNGGGNGGVTYFTVTYKANGGSGADFLVTGIASGSSHLILNGMSTDISRTGYVLTSWNSKADGSGTTTMPGVSFAVTANTTLYAQWTLVATATHSAYIHGYPDDTVRPVNAITRAEAATIFYNLLGDPATTAGGYFSDVANNAWYAQAINYMASLGVLNGYPDGTYKPNAPITRAEFITVVCRFENTAPVSGNAFSDVPGDHWALGYINAASAKGWITGYPDGTFQPGKNITRSEAVTIMNKILNRAIDSAALAQVQNPFSDLSKDYWAYAAIIEASVQHTYSRNASGVEIWQNCN